MLYYIKSMNIKCFYTHNHTQPHTRYTPNTHRQQDNNKIKGLKPTEKCYSPSAGNGLSIDVRSQPTNTVPDAPNTPKYETPLEFLTAVFNNANGLYTPKERINAAIALLPYTEQKLAQTGKKEDALDNAKNKSENGRFATLSNQADMFGSELLQ